MIALSPISLSRSLAPSLPPSLSLSFFFSSFPFLPLSIPTWRPSHKLTLCFQKPFVWLGSRTDSIMSEGQEVKKPQVASCFSLCAMDTGRAGGGGENTFKPEENILQVNIASFFWGSMHAVKEHIHIYICIHPNTFTLDTHHSTQTSTQRSKGKKWAVALRGIYLVFQEKNE